MSGATSTDSWRLWPNCWRTKNKSMTFFSKKSNFLWVSHKSEYYDLFVSRFRFFLESDICPFFSQFCLMSLSSDSWYFSPNHDISNCFFFLLRKTTECREEKWPEVKKSPTNTFITEQAVIVLHTAAQSHMVNTGSVSAYKRRFSVSHVKWTIKQTITWLTQMTLNDL